jgi:peptidoglycan/xylan/chitin deacetylase (PgdA/CDA1 family)
VGDTATVLGNRSGAAAFLCYHSVADGGPPFLSLPPAIFEEQLATLRRLGWRSGNSEDLRESLGGQRPKQPLAFLTFDDGFADNESIALPLLREYGMAPMVFVLPPLLDHGGPLAWTEVTERQRAHPEVMRSMDWQALERMAEAGAEIGSHGLTHRSMVTLEPEALRDELLDSRRILRDRFGRCDALAYPFGHWNSAVARAAADAGYTFAFSVPSNGQPSAGPHAVPRVPVDHRDRGRRFEAKLAATGRRLLLSPIMPLARRMLHEAKARRPGAHR